MIISDVNEVRDLPRGYVIVTKNDHRRHIRTDIKWAMDAAEALIQHGVRKNFDTQADLIAEAINELHWGIGKEGFRAAVEAYDFPSLALR